MAGWVCSCGGEFRGIHHRISMFAAFYGSTPDGRHDTAMRTPDLSGLTYAASIPGAGSLVQHGDADHPCLVVVIDTVKYGYGALADCQSVRDSAVGGGGIQNPDRSVVIASTLVGQQAQTHLSNVRLDAVGLQYPASAATARTALVTDGWINWDAGPAA